MVGILVSFWDGLFSGAMLIYQGVYLEDHLSKWLVTPIYKPFRSFGRGPPTLLRGRNLTMGINHVSKSWDDPPSSCFGQKTPWTGLGFPPQGHEQILLRDADGWWDPRDGVGPKRWGLLSGCFFFNQQICKQSFGWCLWMDLYVYIYLYYL